LGGVKLQGSANYMGGTAKGHITSLSPLAITKLENLRSYQLGAEVGYAGFVAGAGYVNAGKSGYLKATPTTSVNGASQQSWNAGVQYTTGPFMLAAQYHQGQDHGDLGASSGTAKVKGFALGAAYNVTSGPTTGPEYNHLSWSGGDKVSSQSGQDADVLIWSTHMAF
jgi:predicted porin